MTPLSRSLKSLLQGILLVALVLAALTLGGLVLDRFGRLPPLPPYPWNLLGLAPLLLGVQLEAWGTYVLWIYGRGTPNPVTPPLELVAEGPYQYVRNPLYLARLAILVGWGFYLQSLGALFLAVILFLGLHFVVIPREENRLIERFGKAYVGYTKRTPRWFPYIIRRGTEERSG